MRMVTYSNQQDSQMVSSLSTWAMPRTAKSIVFSLWSSHNPQTFPHSYHHTACWGPQITFCNLNMLFWDKKEIKPSHRCDTPNLATDLWTLVLCFWGQQISPRRHSRCRHPPTKSEHAGSQGYRQTSFLFESQPYYSRLVVKELVVIGCFDSKITGDSLDPHKASHSKMFNVQCKEEQVLASKNWMILSSIEKTLPTMVPRDKGGHSMVPVCKPHGGRGSPVELQ